MTEEHTQTNEVQGEHSARDAETQLVLGLFIMYIAAPVLVGTIWADSTAADVVNVIAGATLFAIGGFMAYLGRKKKKSLKVESE